MNNLYVKFSTADARGQFGKPITIEAKAVRWHGLTEEGMLWDVAHADGTDERITVGCAAYGDFSVGSCPERIVDIVVLPWAYPVHTKDEFHSRVGKGKFLHPQRGHFVDEVELPGATITSKGPTP